MKSSIKSFLVFSLACCLVFCKNETPSDQQILETEFNERCTFINSIGLFQDSITIKEYILSNEDGFEVKIINYGGRITSLKIPDRNGKFENVVLNFDNWKQYTENNPYFGALIGRYGNRIANAAFTLDGKTYNLPQNDNNNSLHGGTLGFDKVIWTLNESMVDPGSITLSYFSPDGEMGYPGNLSANVKYTLTENNELIVDYEATTDAPTIVNMTQHAYFNLSGDFDNTILDHEVTIHADQFVPVDEALIPTGNLTDVENTPFDFRNSKTIGKEIEDEHEQIKKGNGYDHCWVLNGSNGEMRFAASAYDPISGRLLEVYTTEPGLQFYTGNFLDGSLPMPGGGKYGFRTGFCLETQHFPDSPNQPTFPSTRLNPGEKYQTTTIFKFSTK